MTQRGKSFKMTVIDMYLFFNPIDPICYGCLEEPLATKESLKNKTYLHVIPVQNFKSISNYIKKNKLNHCDVALRNRIQQISNLITATHKAAQFQGKKRATQFIRELNHFTREYHHDVTDDMILTAAKNANLDIDMLLEDRNSDNVARLCQRSQQIAATFDIQTTPSVVIFDTARESGILIDKDISLDTIIAALNTPDEYLQLIKHK